MVFCPVCLLIGFSNVSQQEGKKGFWSRLIQFNVDILDLSGLGAWECREESLLFVGKFNISAARACWTFKAWFRTWLSAALSWIEIHWNRPKSSNNCQVSMIDQGYYFSSFSFALKHSIVSPELPFARQKKLWQPRPGVKRCVSYTAQVQPLRIIKDDRNLKVLKKVWQNLQARQ